MDPGAGESRKTLMWMGCVNTVHSVAQLFPNGGCLLGVTGCILGRAMGPDGRKGTQYQGEGAQVIHTILGHLKMFGMELASDRGYLDDPGNLGWQAAVAQEPDK